MQLKPFEAGRYDEDLVVIRNPVNGKQELFSPEEFEIVKFLKQNENETLLALLLPNIGIAKKQHILICLRVLSKLKRMQIVDHFSITGTVPVSETSTTELIIVKNRIELRSLGGFAAVLLGLAEKTVAKLGSTGIMLFFFLLATLSFLFFPFQALDAALSVHGVHYWDGLLLAYCAASGGFILRGLLQGAFLKACGREARDPCLCFFVPFIGMDADKREITLTGFQSRMQMDFLGLLAPMGLSSVFTIGALVGAVSLPLAFWGFSGCVLATLILACPFFAFDVADVLQLLFLRSELHERVATGLRHIFEAKGSLTRDMLFGLLATFVWLLVWLDCLRTFWEAVANQVVNDLYTPVVFHDRVAGTLVIGILFFLLFMPALVFLGAFLRGKFGSKRKRVVLKPKEAKESLTFEERMAALEKIPLFSYLNDQERLSLLNEMNPVYFENKAYLVKQGEVGAEFFVLAKGHAGAYFTDQQGKSLHLADLQEGDAFGEIALIDDVPRTASIISDGGCIALSLKKEGFDRFARTLGSSDRVKAMIRLTSFFRRHPLFSKLSAKDQAQLIDTFRFDTVMAGEEIPDQESMFRLIYSGVVRVDTGDDAADTTLLPDDCFGYSNRLQVKFFAAEGTGLLSVRNSEFHNLIWEKLVEKPELFI